MIEALERVKNSFNAYPLDQLAIAGACAAIEDEEYFQEKCEQIISTREKTVSALKDLGFRVIDSQANFVFVKPPQDFSAKAVFLELRERDIVVRYFDKPRINEFLRITIGTDGEMAACIAALTDICTG